VIGQFPWIPFINNMFSSTPSLKHSTNQFSHSEGKGWTFLWNAKTFISTVCSILKHVHQLQVQVHCVAEAGWCVWYQCTILCARTYTPVRTRLLQLLQHLITCCLPYLSMWWKFEICPKAEMLPSVFRQLIKHTRCFTAAMVPAACTVVDQITWWLDRQAVGGTAPHACRQSSFLSFRNAHCDWLCRCTPGRVNVFEVVSYRLAICWWAEKYAPFSGAWLASDLVTTVCAFVRFI
jgi:hypothetical protein